MGDFKTFNIKHYGKVGCFDISNVVNTKVAKLGNYQPHWGSNHLLPVKSAKIEKEKGTCQMKLFYPT